MQEDNLQPQQEESEIDLIEVGHKLWSGRKSIYKGLFFGAIVGLIIAFTTPKEYSTTVKLSPEITDSKSRGASNISALASMAGINLSSGASADAVYPELYPEIVQSVPFLIDLFDVEVNKKDGATITLADYINNDVKNSWFKVVISLPGKAVSGVVSLFKGEEETEEGNGEIDPFNLNKEQWNLVKALRSRINTEVDSKTNVITITTTMQDPLVSAQLADTILSNLNKYIIDYRTSKALQDLNFAQQLNDSARIRYYEVQQQYADYVDKNHNVTLKSHQIEEERLRNEMILAYNLYNSTSTLLQQAQANVQEETPVYAIIQPATVPLQPNSSKFVKIVLFAFLGLLISGVWVLFAPGMKSAFKKIKNGDTESEPASIE